MYILTSCQARWEPVGGSGEKRSLTGLPEGCLTPKGLRGVSDTVGPGVAESQLGARGKYGHSRGSLQTASPQGIAGPLRHCGAQGSLPPYPPFDAVDGPVLRVCCIICCSTKSFLNNRNVSDCNMHRKVRHLVACVCVAKRKKYFSSRDREHWPVTLTFKF